MTEYEKRTIYATTDLLITFISRFEMFSDKQVECIIADLYDLYKTERATQAAVGQFLAQLKAFRYDEV
jgi:hypothetical protein